MPIFSIEYIYSLVLLMLVVKSFSKSITAHCIADDGDNNDMLASSFNYSLGLPKLLSKDFVNLLKLYYFLPK